MRITREQIDAARQTDVLDYLTRCEPGNIRRCGFNTYCLRDHDSLKISNGMWYWFSQGTGGRSALDFLVKVRGFSFEDAVSALAGDGAVPARITRDHGHRYGRPVLEMPELSSDIGEVRKYLNGRGISDSVIDYCRGLGILAQDKRHRSCVFIGFDGEVPRFGCVRSCAGNIKKDLPGSDKRFSFCIPPEGASDEVHVFEGAVDALSYATLEGGSAGAYLLSLSGVYANGSRQEVPAALKSFLERNPGVRSVVLHLDNDAVGRAAARQIADALREAYTVTDSPAPYGKDVNEYLVLKLQKERNRERER